MLQLTPQWPGWFLFIFWFQYWIWSYYRPRSWYRYKTSPINETLYRFRTSCLSGRWKSLKNHQTYLWVLEICFICIIFIYYTISLRTRCSLIFSFCSRYERYFLSNNSSDWLETVLLQLAPVTFNPVLPYVAYLGKILLITIINKYYYFLIKWEKFEYIGPTRHCMYTIAYLYFAYFVSQL